MIELPQNSEHPPKGYNLTIHIFICHTPFQKFLAKTYCDSKNIKKGNFYIFFESLSHGAEPAANNEIIELSGYRGFFDSKDKAKSNFLYIKEFIREKCFDDNFLIYFSDLCWPTNNLLYFRSTNISPQNVIMFVDGLGSYVERKDIIKTHGYSYLKSIISVIRRSPKYTPFLGNYFGYDSSRAIKVIGPNSELIQGSLHKEELKFNHHRNAPTNASQDRLIFLGQPLEGKLCSKEKAEEIVTIAIEKIKKLGYRSLFYKPHHFESPYTNEIFVRHGFISIETNLCLEEMIAQEPYNCVASYFSSGLAFSKIMLGPSVECYSVCFDNVVDMICNKKDKKLLRETLQKFGVEFI